MAPNSSGSVCDSLIFVSSSSSDYWFIIFDVFVVRARGICCRCFFLLGGASFVVVWFVLLWFFGVSWVRASCFSLPFVSGFRTVCVLIISFACGSTSVIVLTWAWGTCAISVLVPQFMTMLTFTGALFLGMVFITYGAKTFVLIFCVDLSFVARAGS